MDLRQNYISKMEQFEENSAPKSMTSDGNDWTIPNREDFLRELTGDQTLSCPFEQVEDVLKLETDRAFIMIAFSGKFSPDAIIDNANFSNKEVILNALLPFCNVNTTDSEVLWMLKSGKRTSVLSDFIFSPNSLESLQIKLPPTDEFGNLLRQITLSIEPVLIEENDRSQLLLLSSVLESIIDLNIPKPEINKVKNLLDFKSFIDNYLHLIESFVGRKNELQKIRTFIEKPNDWSWDVLVLKGVGGVGKSTLLAKICTEILDLKLATLAVIDFDRTSVNSEDTAGLIDEVIKQIAIQFPEERENFKKFSESNQNLQENYSNSRASVLESQEYERISRKNLIDVQRLILNTGKPFIIIFDTIEEVFQQRSFEMLQNFISLIYSNLNPIPIKVIFSGRIQDELNANHDEKQTISLDAFDRATAKVFLQKLNNSEQTIQSILKTTKIPLTDIKNIKRS